MRLIIEVLYFSCWIGLSSLDPVGGSYPPELEPLDSLQPLAGSSRSHLQEPTVDDSHPTESQNLNDSYGQPVVHPQDPVGGNHPNLFSGSQSFMQDHAFQHTAASEFPIHDPDSYHDQEISNVAQSATQVPATPIDPTSFMPGSSQATQSGSGEHSAHDQYDFMATLGQDRPLNLKVKRPSSNHANFISPMIPHPSAPRRSKKPARSKIFLSSLVVTSVKKASSTHMTNSLFEESLCPREIVLTRLANAAITRAADTHNDGILLLPLHAYRNSSTKQQSLLQRTSRRGSRRVMVEPWSRR